MTSHRHRSLSGAAGWALGLVFAFLLAFAGTAHAAPTFNFAFGSYGEGNGQFSYPHGTAVDGNGNLLVADYNNHRIQKFNASGEYVSQFGAYGYGQGQLRGPLDIAIDSEGDLWVVDWGGEDGRVQQFSSAGSFMSEIPLFTANGVAIDSEDNVYVSSYIDGMINKYDQAGKQLGGLSPGSGKYTSFYPAPASLVVEAPDVVWAADPQNQRVVRVSSEEGVSTIEPEMFEQPWSVAVDGEGSVYVTDGFARVMKFDAEGSLLEQFGEEGEGEGQLADPHGLTLDPSGESIWISDSGNNRIQNWLLE